MPNALMVRTTAFNAIRAEIRGLHRMIHASDGPKPPESPGHREVGNLAGPCTAVGFRDDDNPSRKAMLNPSRRDTGQHRPPAAAMGPRPWPQGG